MWLHKPINNFFFYFEINTNLNFKNHYSIGDIMPARKRTPWQIRKEANAFGKKHGMSQGDINTAIRGILKAKKKRK